MSMECLYLNFSSLCGGVMLNWHFVFQYLFKFLHRLLKNYKHLVILLIKSVGKTVTHTIKYTHIKYSICKNGTIKKFMM